MKAISVCLLILLGMAQCTGCAAAPGSDTGGAEFKSRTTLVYLPVKCSPPGNRLDLSSLGSIGDAAVTAGLYFAKYVVEDMASDQEATYSAACGLCLPLDPNVGVFVFVRDFQDPQDKTKTERDPNYVEHICDSVVTYLKDRDRKCENDANGKPPDGATDKKKEEANKKDEEPDKKKEDPYKKLRKDLTNALPKASDPNNSRIGLCVVGVIEPTPSKNAYTATIVRYWYPAFQAKYIPGGIVPNSPQSKLTLTFESPVGADKPYKADVSFDLEWAGREPNRVPSSMPARALVSPPIAKPKEYPDLQFRATVIESSNMSKTLRRLADVISQAIEKRAKADSEKAQ